MKKAFSGKRKTFPAQQALPASAILPGNIQTAAITLVHGHTGKQQPFLQVLA
jgi:hypothetical protein